MLVFVPLTGAELAAWAETGRHRPASGYAVTPALRSAFGFSLADEEDAEHTVLHIAGLAALLAHGRRLVAVAEASVNPLASEFGEVRIGVLPWPTVSAVFADEDPAATDALRERLGGTGLDAAWDDPEVADLLAEHELLWHGPGEWNTLV